MRLRATALAQSSAPTLPVDADQLWSDIMTLADITEPAKPYTRRSFSPLFLKGREWLASRFAEAGLSTRIDAAGNLIGRRDGRERMADTIMIGSHSDTVPSGGRFDGIAGVAAGLAIARTLKQQSIELRHGLEIVDFLAEEPSEYGVSCIGSRGITGKLSAEHLAQRNGAGETVADAMRRVGGRPEALAIRNDVIAGFELHIEQGPVLEKDKVDIGLVTSIVGITRFEVSFVGHADHAGTTPMDRRQDALVAAARLIVWVRRTAEEFARKGEGYFVATVGIVEALPGGANVVPGEARIVIDARSEQRGLMEIFRWTLDAEAKAAAADSGVELKRLATLSDGLPAECDRALRKALGKGANRFGLSSIELASGAGHDMAFLSLVAPVAMVFIPCRGGRSHCPEEWAEPQAIAAGTSAIYEAILDIDSSR